MAMFGKLSRYRRVPDVAAPDASGRVVASKDFRALPAVTGTFRHTVDAGDRLDQLAHSYHDEPLRYWHICDANPDFLSPLDLLDGEPVITVRVPVTAPGGGPPWAAALNSLRTLIGVQQATAIEDVTLVEVPRTIGGKQVIVVEELFDRAIVVAYHRAELDVPAIVATIGSTGFDTGMPVEGGQLGQRIVIPPAVSG